jgi:hypothetical protein
LQDASPTSSRIGSKCFILSLFLIFFLMTQR